MLFIIWLLALQNGMLQSHRLERVVANLCSSWS